MNRAKATEIKLLWNRLIESQILNESICSAFRQKFESLDHETEPEPENLAHWLCEQKAISPFQANILLGGSDGPFRFGNYLLIDQLYSESAGSCFHARHMLTGHNVMLEFVAGDQAEDLERWRAVKRIANVLVPARQVNLVRVFETVAVPEYRFVVTELPSGKPLSSRLPEKSRIDWNKATTMIAQVAAALSQLHRSGIGHGSLSTKSVLLGKSGNMQLPCPFANMSVNNEPLKRKTRAEDLRALGGIWYRLITGKLPDSKPDQKVESRLEKYKVPEQIIASIRSLLDAGHTADLIDLEDVVLTCKAALGVDSFECIAVQQLTLAAYESWLQRTPDMLGVQKAEKVDASQLQFNDGDEILLSAVNAAVELKSDSTDTSSVYGHGRKSSRGLLMSIAGSFLAISALIVIVVVGTLTHPNGPDQATAGNADNSAEPASEMLLNNESIADIKEQPLEAYNNRAFRQILAADDGKLLWETPTTGRPLDFSFIPRSPKLAFSFRIAELLAADEGKRIMQALGPALNAEFVRWIEVLGIPLEEIGNVLLTLHSNDEYVYDTFCLIDLASESPVEELLEAWGNPTVRSDAAGIPCYSRDEQNCFAITKGEAGAVQQFAYGPEWLIEESLELGEVNPVAGSMKRLANWSDQSRHANLLFLRPALFNDEGQSLMSGPMAMLNRELQVATDPNIRGGLISLHLDSDAYLELRLDATVDLNAAQLERQIADLLQLANQFSASFAAVSANSHWEQVKVRYSQMVDYFVDHWRIGIEDKQVIANCWLPPTALHNLIAATELALAIGEHRHNDSIAAGKSSVPRTLEELLAVPRDLTVATGPDLIVLLQNLQQEISDDYGKLPFEFEIRLMGADLAREGITQNQRPGELALKQQPLSSILTEIMVKANPNKNISGPADANCKMVWVVADDPNMSNRKIIMITTRKAALENSYELPDAFLVSE